MIAKLKREHQDKQIRENEDWNHERRELKERNHELDLKLKRQIDAADEKEEKLKKEVEKKRVRKF